MNGIDTEGRIRRLVFFPGKRGCFFCALVFFFLSGCVYAPFARLYSNLRSMENNSYITGTVSHPSKTAAKIIVAVYGESGNGSKLIASTRVEKGKYFAFIVPRSGEYCLAAFEDQNGTGAYAQGVPSAVMCGEERISIDKNTRFVRFDLALDPAYTLPKSLAADLLATKPDEKNCVHVAFGEVAELNSPRFSSENGKKGLWAPFDFLSEAGIGVYFLEPYDPRKIPVLFINGAGGSPWDWAYFIDNLDERRFQPWFFFYPSGERLGNMANTLNEIISNLHKQYRFPKLYVTAHSMGGLIGRDFILRQIEARSTFVKLFVSLSTPWDGLESAKLGVTLAPATVPCWYDIQAGSPYLSSLFSHQLAPNVPFFLLFSYRGDRNPLSENNDGIVTVKSQMRWEAQAEALKVYGFNQEHDMILVNRDVFDAYALILDQAERGDAVR